MSPRESLVARVLARLQRETNARARARRPRRDNPRLKPDHAPESLETRALLAAAPVFVPGEILVQFQPAATPLDQLRARLAVGGEVAEVIQPPGLNLPQNAVLPRGGPAPRFAENNPHAAQPLERILLAPGLDVERALATLAANPAVAFAEPNWIYTTQYVSNDPFYTTGSRLWGLYSPDTPNPVGPAGTTNVFGSAAELAWAAGHVGSRSVHVGVIDEGYQHAHPDLAANAWLNPFEAGDGIDNDGNGYVDDLRGWDFHNNDNSVYDGTEDDHGTHVAGTIGAVGGNALGVVGVNWNVTLVGAKFLGANGGTTANAVRAVNYMTDLKLRHGIDLVATNNSWGGGGYSRALHEAIIRAAKADILFVAAAGNNNANNDATPFYPANYSTLVGTPGESPASYEAVISVAAITNTGARASFSNFGANTVHLGAPGAAINSTLPNNAYGAYSGTSMAAPHVAGAAALYASVYPVATAAQIREAIIAGALATPTPSLAGITTTGGRLNIPATIAHAPPPVISVADAAVLEGDSGTAKLTFRITLSHPAPRPVAVEYATADGTATAASGDYVPVQGKLVIPAGALSADVSVLVNGDTLVEPDETLLLHLANPTDATVARATATGTILNDDLPPPVVSVADVSALEGNSGTTPFVFTLVRTGNLANPTTLLVSTADGTATFADNDYIPLLNHVVVFNPGEASKTVTVLVVGDPRVEPDETFHIDLFSPVGATLANTRATAVILNDDFPGGGGGGGAVPAPPPVGGVFPGKGGPLASTGTSSGRGGRNATRLSPALVALVNQQAQIFWNELRAGAFDNLIPPGFPLPVPLPLLPPVIPFAFATANLPGRTLAQWTPETATIVLDVNAAGRGWFIDQTPFQNSEFPRQRPDGSLAANRRSPANGKYDLVTVVAHEIGHALGIPHQPAGLMAPNIPPGTRHPLSLDTLNNNPTLPLPFRRARR